MESTKKIDERRRIRKELRDIKERKEKFLDENGNEKPAPAVASKFVMRVGSTTKRDEPDSGKFHRDRSPTRKENLEPEKPKSTRSTFSFKLSSNEDQDQSEAAAPSCSRRAQRNAEKAPSEELPRRRTQPTREDSPGDERRSRRTREPNNTEGTWPRAAREQPEQESAAPAPKRMTRRASLAELFKIDQEGAKPRAAPTQKKNPEPPATVQVTQKRMYAETKTDAQTKHGLIQNLTKLRSRRRSVREIERKEELEGLMYVKSGDSVKLVSTSKGDDEVGAQERRREGRREGGRERGKERGTERGTERGRERKRERRREGEKERGQEGERERRR